MIVVAAAVATVISFTAALVILPGDGVARVSLSPPLVIVGRWYERHANYMPVWSAIPRRRPKNWTYAYAFRFGTGAAGGNAG